MAISSSTQMCLRGHLSLHVSSSFPHILTHRKIFFLHKTNNTSLTFHHLWPLLTNTNTTLLHLSPSREAITITTEPPYHHPCTINITHNQHCIIYTHTPFQLLLIKHNSSTTANRVRTAFTTNVAHLHTLSPPLLHSSPKFLHYRFVLSGNLPFFSL